MASLNAPPEEYRARVSAAMEDVAGSGRGDNAKGRNLAALHVLDHAYRHDWLGYRPSRDPAKWIVMLLDLIGSQAGIEAERRAAMTMRELLELMDAHGLPALVDVTRDAAVAALARGFGLSAASAEVVLMSLAVDACLWKLGFDPAEVLTSAGERHPQGRVVRKKIAKVLDGAWSAALEEHEEARSDIGFVDVIAAIPPSFEETFGLIESTLERVGESLEEGPFAVYWALATDAAKGGRRWDPPDRYVEGWAYARRDFDLAVGRDLMGAPSKQKRYDESVALSELGLSATFPSTIAVLDRWLAAYPNSELSLAAPSEADHDPRTWMECVAQQRDAIDSVRMEIHERIERKLRASGGKGGGTTNE